MKLITIILLSAFLLQGCNSSKEGAFAGLDTPASGVGEVTPTPAIPVHIGSFTPVSEPVIMTASSSMVFGLTLDTGAEGASYDFTLDNSSILQTGLTPFFSLDGATLSGGVHHLKARAFNATSEDFKEFTIRKNRPSQIVTHLPSTMGNSINCGTGSITFSGVMVDADNDTFTVNWQVDGSTVTPATSFTSVTTTMPYSQMVYSPDCTQTGNHVITLKVYDGYEVVNQTWNLTVNNPPPPPGSVAIQTFSPTIDPVVLTQASSETFAVTIADNGAGTVVYEFIQDNSATLQTGATNFYSLSGASLTPGYHSLKAKVTNSVSTTEKVFNIRKNSPPVLLSFSPSASGGAINCAAGTMTFDIAFSDADGDSLTKTWILDDANVGASTPFTTLASTAGTSQLAYSPDCTKTGSHSVSFKLTDGYETITKTWTFSVNNPPPPPGAVQISGFTPGVDPVVMTESSVATFAVSIHDGAGVVDYEFKKDYATVIQNGSSPFMVLTGSSLTAGNHTIKVKGTNSVSYDEKVFNIRKNTPPVIASYTPALSGSMVNCSQGTLTFSSVMTDIDADTMTKSWELDGAPVTNLTEFTSISSGPFSGQLAYSPDCTKSGVHTVALKISDGYEVSTVSWSFTVVNPAVENISSYFPTSNNLTYLSTESSKTFNVSGAGVGALTFKWKLDGTLIKTDANVATSSLPLASADMTYGTHTLEVFLTDSTTSNDPSSPVKQTWTVYKNMKPRILSYSPVGEKFANLNNMVTISASIEDSLDTFVVSFSRGSVTCTPNGSGASSACGQTGMNFPTSTGSFSSNFVPGATFLGENNFQIKITDSHGEYITQDFVISANYFSDACNSLGSGQICTLVGLPGLGSGLNVVSELNKIRISPSWMTQDGQGNWFFSDHGTNVVWYYNAKSTPVSIFGYSVPANSIKVVAGTGIAGAGGNGIAANTFALNFGNYGGGLAWDTRDQALYIADYTNSRVVRINNTGRANVICGLGSVNTQGALASTNECNTPVDIEIDNTNRRLYVSLQNKSMIKYIDISSTDITAWPAYVLAGIATTTGANNSGTTNLTAFPGTTIAGTSRLNQPWGLNLDVDDQILYYTEWGSCRVRALGLPGATTRTVAGTSISAGNNVAITTTASCASEAASPAIQIQASVYRFNKPVDVAVQKNASGVKGFFVSDNAGHRVAYCNNTNATVTYGFQDVESQACNNVLGNGSATSSTIPPSGKTTSINNPIGLVLTPSGLVVGDRGYNQLRTLSLSSGNGTVATYIGGIGRAGYSGNAPLDSRLVTFNNPVNIFYRESNQILYVSDVTNAIIRSVNMQDGRVEDFAGGIYGNETRLNTTATSTNMIQPKGMAAYGNFFFYADTTNNCFVRAYNPNPQPETIFGTSVNSNRTGPVAGYYNNCGAFVGTSEIQTNDSNAKLSNPYGIGIDSSARVMYVASRDAHCIVKVTEGGGIKPIIGVCGTVAPTPVYGDTYNSANLKLRFPSEIVMDPLHPGNFFFNDFTDQATAHVKYANLTESSVVINGITVSQNNVETIYGLVSSPGYIRSIAAFENMLCFSSGTTTAGQGNNTVSCYNRDNADTTVFTRFGIAGAGAIQLQLEQEGISAVSATFAAPGGLSFDKKGNLLVSEQGSHVIRMIKKWW